MEFFVVFYSKEKRWYQRILEISKSSFTKIYMCQIIFFFKIPRFTIFFIFVTFTFQFYLSVLVKKLWKFLCFVYFMDKRFFEGFLENHGTLF